jgi:hypothetical protein
MKKPSVRGKLRLMASGIKIPDNPYVEAGMLIAQQDLEMMRLLNVMILANAIFQNDKGVNELVNKAIKLIYFEDSESEKVEEDSISILKSFRGKAFKIDTSSVPMDQNHLVRKRQS